MDELPEDEPRGDERLDGLFREAADGHQPTFNPADWADLNQRLDQHDRTTFWAQWLRRGLYALLLLLLTGAGLWFWRQNEPSGKAASGGAKNPAVTSPQTDGTGLAQRETSGEAPNSAATIEKEKTKSASSPDGTALTRVQSSEDPAATGGAEAVTPEKIGVRPGASRPEAFAGRANPDAPLSGPSVGGSLPTSKNVDKYVDKSINGRGSVRTNTRKKSLYRSEQRKTGSFELSTPVAAQTRRRRPIAGAKQPEANDIFNPEHRPIASSSVAGSPVAGSPVAGRSDGSRKTGASTASDPVTSSQAAGDRRSSDPAAGFPDSRLALGELPLLATRPLWRPDSLLRQETPYFEASGATEPRVTPPPRWSPLSIRVAATPDMSFLGGKGPALALTYGGLLEYQFTRRFVLQGGVLRSVKQYYAGRQDYTFQHWYQQLKPDRIEAHCTLLDIPINLRFNALINERRRWFISGGISTYIMRKEKYEYYYDQIPPGTQIRYWNLQVTPATGRFNASHLNFSVGYERSFSRRLSWQAEPFLKAPLKGVGWGKVRLLTTGVLFSLRYNL